MTQVGILLSEKTDRVPARPRARAPTAPGGQRPPRPGLHRGDEGRACRTRPPDHRDRADHGYDSVFAGYGFMAEDQDFVPIEEAGLTFISPSRTR